MKFNQQEINNGKLIYDKLPDKTLSGNVVIRSVYGLEGVAYAKSLNGVFTLRLSHTENHFGNLYSSNRTVLLKDKTIIPTDTTRESVSLYITWILYGEDDRCIWIRKILDSGKLKDKPLVYYKELNEPSHANALDYLINNWDNLEI